MRMLLWCSMVLSVLGAVYPTEAAAQVNPEVKSCETEYRQAEDAYFSADFDRAIRLLETCLEEVDLETDTRVQFHRLLAFAYLAQADREEARLVVESLLDVDETYAPSPAEDRPDFVELVQEVKDSRIVEEDDGRRWWRWVAGGAATAVAGIAVAVLTGGGNDGGGNGTSQPLPGPPVPNN